MAIPKTPWLCKKPARRSCPANTRGAETGIREGGDRGPCRAGKIPVRTGRAGPITRQVAASTPNRPTTPMTMSSGVSPPGAVAPASSRRNRSSRGRSRRRPPPTGNRRCPPPRRHQGSPGAARRRKASGSPRSANPASCACGVSTGRFTSTSTKPGQQQGEEADREDARPRLAHRGGRLSVRSRARTRSRLPGRSGRRRDGRRRRCRGRRSAR